MTLSKQHLISLLVNQPIWEDIGKMERESQTYSEFVLDYYLKNSETLNKFFNIEFVDELLIEPKEYTIKDFLLENKVNIKDNQSIKRFFINAWSPSCCYFKESWHAAKDRLPEDLRKQLNEMMRNEC